MISYLVGRDSKNTFTNRVTTEENFLKNKCIHDFFLKVKPKVIKAQCPCRWICCACCLKQSLLFSVLRSAVTLHRPLRNILLCGGFTAVKHMIFHIGERVLSTPLRSELRSAWDKIIIVSCCKSVMRNARNYDSDCKHFPQGQNIGIF